METVDQHIEDILYSVSDPEIPVLSIVDMGIIKKVEKLDDHFLIHITPTYSGCPAMDTIEDDIVKAFDEEGLKAKVKHILSPAWTTDMITEKGKKALEEYGIAAPRDASIDKAALSGEKNQIKCTNCGSMNTKMVSRFGSTACKALFQCEDCGEPFDYFKCLR
ncbi:MAG: phenylacetate-CoA oxygenase subunit PaaJ [Flavobacteriales bacterium]|nr:phenylacetate-CoA oxygenase subunit PaaJ [Flavobacteriales bacterium]|tara:strand:+ start:287 stop:775 length:489 start_codon:yes stop_codon:yes gene_type:complete